MSIRTKRFKLILELARRAGCKHLKRHRMNLSRKAEIKVHIMKAGSLHLEMFKVLTGPDRATFSSLMTEAKHINKDQGQP